MGRTTTIGVLSPVVGGYYYGKVLEGITREVAAVEGRVVLLQTLDAGITSDEVVSAPDYTAATSWDHLDGVISIATGTQRGFLDRLLAQGKPIALVSDEIEGLDVPRAVPDNGGGIAAAVAHLVEHGHARIGFGGNLVQPDMRARYEGYLAGLSAHGIEADPSWYIAALDNGELGGADIACRLVAAGLPVTALIAATDRNALGCMAKLLDLGLKVPDDLAIVGYDGIDAGTYSEPSLSTVVQRFDALGAAAALLVLAQLDGDRFESSVHVSPSELVARGSCGCGGIDGAGSADNGERTAFWRHDSTTHRERSALREHWLRSQYEVNIALLDRGRGDPRDLGWLSATDVRGAYLALWDGDPSAGRLTVAGCYDPGGVLPDLAGRATSAGSFPPVHLLDLADTAANEVTIVLPLRARGMDFGLLAVVGQVDTLSANGRETHNQWAALLTAALEQQALHEDLRTSEERYSLWALAADDGLWDWDLATDLIFFSGRCMQMLGGEDRGVTAAPSVWLDAVHPDDVDRLRNAMLLAGTHRLEAGDVERAIDVGHRVRGPDGTFRRVSCRALPVGTVGQTARRIVGSIHDIETRKQLEEQLRRGALYDAVTGLPNRKLFHDQLRRAMRRMERSPDHGYAVVFLDLDGFKLVNDSLGHLMGDRLLATIGERLSGVLREADLAARFGGDEFAMLLHDVDPASVESIVKRVQHALAAPVALDGHQVAVSASAGVATSAGGYTEAQDVLRDADTAMYHAKVARRGSWAMFEPAMHEEARQRLERMGGRLCLGGEGGDPTARPLVETAASRGQGARRAASVPAGADEAARDKLPGL